MGKQAEGPWAEGPEAEGRRSEVQGDDVLEGKGGEDDDAKA